MTTAPGSRRGRQCRGNRGSCQGIERLRISRLRRFPVKIGPSPARFMSPFSLGLLPKRYSHRRLIELENAHRLEHSQTGVTMRKAIFGLGLAAFAATSAMAADMPAPGPYYTKAPPPPVYNWTGLYVEIGRA